MEVTTIGLDPAKNVFQLHGVDARGSVVLRKKLTRSRMLPFFANLSPCLVGMEAQAASNYWAREIAALGHEVRLISPQFVKPYVKSSKNDANDAEAVCEAVTRPSMRFVAPKTTGQQDIQTLHRLRQSLVRDRTAKANQIRGLLAEYGIVMARGMARLKKQVPAILEDAENGLTPFCRELLADAYRQLLELDVRVGEYDRRVQLVHRSSPVCMSLASIPGVGPLTATAIVASVGNASHFKNGRQMAAWLGLVPRQHWGGQKTRLLGISKRGDRYLKNAHGARCSHRRASLGRQTGPHEPLGKRRQGAARHQQGRCGAGQQERPHDLGAFAKPGVGTNSLREVYFQGLL